MKMKFRYPAVNWRTLIVSFSIGMLVIIAHSSSSSSKISIEKEVRQKGFSEHSLQVQIPDSMYVVARGERLYLGKHHIRYWGLITAIAGDPGIEKRDSPEIIYSKVEKNNNAIDVFVNRIADMGFNLVRTWEGRYPHQLDDLPLLYDHDYEPGDGSDADAIAYSWYALDKAGIKLWMSSTNGTGTITPDDVDIIDDPDSENDWKNAAGQLLFEGKPMTIRKATELLLPTFDERVEALWIKRLQLLTDFPNKYKEGDLRLGDDPQVVVWELINEEFPYRRFFNGHWMDLPVYFQKKLVSRWNDFLKKKYPSEKSILDSWGFLLPGESLSDGTIMLLPMATSITGDPVLSDTNPAIIESLKTRKKKYGRDDFNRARGEDVIAFANELIISHKQRMEKALHSMGKSCLLSPTIYDAGNSFRIQSSYMHQFADAVATCSYTKGMGHDPNDKRFPFFSQLDDSPRTSWGVPWFEQSTNLGQPHFVYETNIDNRTKYRAEYPLRMAALASIQDWDIVCWHTYPGRDKEILNENSFQRYVNCAGDYFTLRGDEILIGALRAASEIFINKLIEPAPDPVLFTFGKNALLDPVSMDYGKSYEDYASHFIGTTYRYGSRVKVDTSLEDSKIDGRHTVRPNVYESNPIIPNDQITYNWQDAYLLMDSKGCASYTGFYGEYGADKIVFKNNDVQLSNITFYNPSGIAYPVTPDEGYCNITIASCDGKALEEADKILIVPVSTGFNKGYELDLTKSNKFLEQDGPESGGPQEFWGPYTKGGTAPVHIVRVGVTIHSNALNGMKYVFRDWYMNEIKTGVVKSNKLTIPNNIEVWIVELTR